jgi:ubiquinone/menaquinone biosynthesis C-methylase UbiE
MKNSDVDKASDERKVFEKIKSEIRHGFYGTLNYWQQIRKRYVYQGRQYSAQEVTHWFMTAPFDEVKAIGETLGIGWRTIGSDVARMADAVQTANALRLEEKQGLFPEIKEPFDVDRDISRLLFDFSILISCIRKTDNMKILDFAGGTGWVAEYLNRAGFDVYIFDIAPSTVRCVESRIQADLRVDGTRLHSAVCNAHQLSIYENNYFGNIVCFDSLHHMVDFDAVFSEMFRVLEPGGRAAFVEPGARHAESKETKDFIKKYKADDPDWIERSIVLEEINDIACGAGFRALRIKPFLLPSDVDFVLDEWRDFAKNQRGREKYFSRLQSFNSNERVIFYVEKPLLG